MNRLVYLIFCVCLVVLPGDGSAGVPELPSGCKTLSSIVLDIKAPLNRKLDQLRRTYGIEEVKAGGLHFIDKNGSVVLTVESNRSVTPDGTQRVEEFLYRNREQRLILHEKVITRGEGLELLDFEQRLFQSGVENYDLAGSGETTKDATIHMGGQLLRVLSSRSQGENVDIKRHRVWVGENQQLEIEDTIHHQENYRSYEYRISDSQIRILATGHPQMGWAGWQGTFRVDIRELPGLHLPEVTYERAGTAWSVKDESGKLSILYHARINGLERFSRELHENMIVPFIERGPIHVIDRVIRIGWLWPKSRSIQTIGSESRFLNELIVIRNEVNQAKTNPAILSLVEVKLNVIIKDIQEGSLKINDFRNHAR